MSSRYRFIEDNKLHVFVADDDIDDVTFFQKALVEVSKNVKITTAANGLELLEFLQVVIPDLIFLDINMPLMNGIECLREIRKLKAFENVPVIIYSTTAKESDILLTHQLGANLYIQKPITFQEIKSKITRTLSLHLKDLVPQPSLEKFYLDLTPAETQE